MQSLKQKEVIQPIPSRIISSSKFLCCKEIRNLVRSPIHSKYSIQFSHSATFLAVDAIDNMCNTLAAHQELSSDNDGDNDENNALISLAAQLAFEVQLSFSCLLAICLWRVLKPLSHPKRPERD